MKSNQQSVNRIKIVAVVVILAVFIFFRWYKLHDTLLFYNDMGRDFIALLNWSESGKPPLLGPQTSVVSYNQSAWYFYFLFPLFVLTNHSALSSTLTIILFGSFVYFFLVAVHRKNNWYFWLISLSFALLAVHPQVVLQNRFIWNPSFIPYFLLVSMIATVRLSKEFSTKWAAVFWLSAAFAVGFSYSALPIIITTILYLAVKNKKYWLQHLGLATAAGGIVLLPLLVFEARHNFALTRLFLEGQTTPQTAVSIGLKTTQLLQLIFEAQSKVMSMILFLFTTVSLSLGYLYGRKYNYSQLSHLQFFIGSLIVNTVLFLFLPVNLEKHYIFPIVVLLLLSIAALPKRLAIFTTVMLLIFWAQPYFLNKQTVIPVRSISDMEQCYAHFCKTFTTPAYVSMESGILTGYHNALEHQFFLREAGCTVYNIVDHQDQAATMLVIGDNTEYTHGKSAYYELTLFGDATQSGTFSCTDNLKIYQLDKI